MVMTNKFRQKEIWNEKENKTQFIEDNEVKFAAIHFLGLSQNICSDAVDKVIQLIQSEKSKTYVFLQHVTDLKGCMELFDESVGQSLNHKGFQNIEGRCKTASNNKGK